MRFDSIIALRAVLTVYRNGDMCIKVFEPGFTKASEVYSEALNHALVYEAGVCVPKLFGVRQLGDKLAIETELIRAKTLDRLMRADQTSTDEYLLQLVKAQLEINRKSCGELISAKTKLSRLITSCELDEKTRNRLLLELEAAPDGDSVCHGELIPENLLVSEDGIVTVDWAEAFSGAEVFDAALTYLQLLLNNPELAKPYLELYCELSGCECDRIRSLLPITAAARSVGRPQREREFMLSVANGNYNNL